jgi:hypothetical protein
MEEGRNKKFGQFCQGISKYFPAAKTLTLYLAIDVTHVQDAVQPSHP